MTVTNESGIYKIVNLVNGKMYIGSAVKLDSRRKRHFYELRKNIHHNEHLQNSYNKHGRKAFKFEVIEIVDNVDILPEREQFHIDGYNFDYLYNIEKFVNIPMLGLTHSDETKQKMSESHSNKILSEEHKRNLSIAHTGKSHSQEHIRKVVNTLIGREVSEETKQKIAMSQPARKPVIQLDKDTDEVIAIFNSISDAGKFTSINYSHISAVCRGVKYRPTAGGYKWKFA